MAIRFYSQECDFLPPGRRRIAAWVRETVASEGYKPGEIAFVFCSPEYHIEVNRKYLGHDYHTDVITFDYSDLAEGIVSGDIMIDQRQVAEQAAGWGSTPEEELKRIMIHGILHLCGYGDKTPEEQQVMRAKEEQYMAKY